MNISRMMEEKRQMTIAQITTLLWEPDLDKAATQALQGGIDGKLVDAMAAQAEAGKTKLQAAIQAQSSIGEWPRKISQAQRAAAKAQQAFEKARDASLECDAELRQIEEQYGMARERIDDAIRSYGAGEIPKSFAPDWIVQAVDDLRERERQASIAAKRQNLVSRIEWLKSNIPSLEKEQKNVHNRDPDHNECMHSGGRFISVYDSIGNTIEQQKQQLQRLQAELQQFD